MIWHERSAWKFSSLKRWRDTQCACQEYAIRAALAPDDVVTVRTYTYGRPYDPALVRKSEHQDP